MSWEESTKPRLRTILMIFHREMRDQLRDRRTVFTIVVLPMLLYPLVGMLLLQIAQFTQQHAPRIGVIGTENLPAAPVLVADDGIAPAYQEAAGNAEFEFHSWQQIAQNVPVSAMAQQYVDHGLYDAVLLVPPDFQLATQAARSEAITSLRIVTKPGADTAAVASDRVNRVLGEWRSSIISQHLARSGLSDRILRPFTVSKTTAAAEGGKAMMWSKLLPFVMLVWALTGAFYPAIDLIAGEKERGTLETLLCSPALRSEIVWGKLATVTTFSILTSVLNVCSMMVTSSLVFSRVGFGTGGMTFGPPPLEALMWLAIALLPLAILFSALALAVAAMARSSKEGQYYLMPLMMVALPLVLLPMMPGINLNVGTAMVPVSGMFLLVRALVEGDYLHALLHLPMVGGVTFTCLWLATRWARRQFADESVLFGSGDQWELRSWMRHLWRDRQATPSAAQAFGCGAIVLVGLFFGKLMATGVPGDMNGLMRLILTPQVGLILAPAILMAIILTTSLKETFRVTMPRWTALPVAVLLGLTLHPSYVALGEFIRAAYPVGQQTAAALAPMENLMASAPTWNLILLLALVPALCEELTFRGFIFSGLLRGNARMRAVLVTAVMFGISHGMLQQSIAATVMGLLLGWIALRSGSVLPCLIIHLVNNSLSILMGRVSESSWRGADFFLRQGADGSVGYEPLWTLMASALAVTCILYFYSLPEPASPELTEDQDGADAALLNRIANRAAAQTVSG